jgi:hypothetical protein
MKQCTSINILTASLGASEHILEQPVEHHITNDFQAARRHLIGRIVQGVIIRVIKVNDIHRWNASLDEGR